jgi:hypothetical protein
MQKFRCGKTHHPKQADSTGKAIEVDGYWVVKGLIITGVSDPGYYLLAL